MKRYAKKILIIPDTHVGSGKNGGHDEAAFRTMLKAIEIVKPDEAIHLGDVGEWESCSPWEFSRRKRPPLQYTLKELDAEVVLVNDFLDRIDAALNLAGCKRRTMLEGNHEVWVRNMVSEMDLVAEAYSVPKLLKLRQRGWGWAPYGEYVKRGHLRFYHGGHYTTVQHAYQHAVKLGCSVVYGHTHDVQYVTVPSVEGPHGGFAMGCLCRLDKDFLLGRMTNWQTAFGIVYLNSDGTFLVNQCRIEKGWTVVEGVEIRNGVEQWAT